MYTTHMRCGVVRVVHAVGKKERKIMEKNTREFTGRGGKV